ncbi:ribonuclease HII [Mycolicibacterium peregrinum]|uniref:ribonuclease HII n=1 Tax=Mycolicibacterium peregrinum TaxID=43304 RepID=UPI0007EBD421|nr:ribonuclease HII [Mycolicibacterium peregrinum]OBF37230.1 ribonuclease HII [Mycolicibacterium peregrinum]
MKTSWPPRPVIRRSSGLRTLESALYRNGLGPVAGVDEVGRGACAGPLVVAACVLGPNRMDSLASLDDSKKLGERERERLFPLIRRYALAYHVVFIPSDEVDRLGVHVANIEGMRRAVAGLSLRPGYVLSDGFRVPGLAVPSLPVIGGDAAAACIAAASVLAKVSRDRLMVEMEQHHPGYGFAEHKGYSTPAHSAALTELGPCVEHRYSYVNVRRAAETVDVRRAAETVDVRRAAETVDVRRAAEMTDVRRDMAPMRHAETAYAKMVDRAPAQREGQHTR